MQEETRRFSIALIRCCGESKCQGALGLSPPLLLSPILSFLLSSFPCIPLLFSPDLYLCLPPPSPHHHSPPQVQLKVGLALPQRPPPPRHHHHFFSLCQTNLQLLLFTSVFPVKVHCPPSPLPLLPTTSAAPATFSFSFFQHLLWL